VMQTLLDADDTLTPEALYAALKEAYPVGK